MKDLLPMVYLILGAAIAVVGTIAELPPEVTGMLVGAALTRVRKSTIPEKKKEEPKPAPPEESNS